MRTLEISSLSKEYVRVRVKAKEAGADVDPTADTVVMAFVADGEPAALDYKAATWETDTSTTPDTYYARCLVGPGGTVTLTDGLYKVFVKVTDNPEVPVKHAGHLKVT